MIADLYLKIKPLWVKNRTDLLLSAMVFLVGLASFGLGRLSAIWPAKEPILIDQAGKIDKSASGLDENVLIERSNSSASSLSSPRGNFVASKNGSAYHYPWCPGAKQIKEENKIWFATADEAQKAGYKPAGNCPGL